MKCPLFCPYMVIGDYGYKCKKFKLGLKTEGGVPERCPQCEDGGRDKDVPLRK